MLPYDIKAYKLLHNGSIALSRVERNGIRIDMGYLNNAIEQTHSKIKILQDNIQGNEVMKEWKRMFGRNVNFGSTEQLGKVLFDGIGLSSPALTKTGRYKVDEQVLSTLDHPFVKDYLEIKKLQKIHTTYLKGIRREVVNGLLHPMFNLNTVSTFRSSSDRPNFQNIPIRNPELSKLVRTAFIAREGCHFGELDFSGIEVGIAACYHKDPTMLSYIKDKTKDMHRDMARECFALPDSEMTPKDDADKKRIKMIRYCGKNMFVFPQFYGDWYIDCARALWQAIELHKLKRRDGTSLYTHLKAKGIHSLGALDPREKPEEGTFEKHIQEVEQGFWNDRFPVYSEWKKQWITQYEKKGYMLTKTGFICQGHMKRNQIINFPVQGSAFHCLLQCLIWLVMRELKKNKMRTLIIGQIHDSIVADIVGEELDDFLGIANRVMTKDLLEYWNWVIVPLEIEAEISPLNGTWADKKVMELK